MWKSNNKKVSDFLKLPFEVGDLVAAAIPNHRGLSGIVVDVKSNSDPYLIHVQWNDDSFNIYTPEELYLLTAYKKSKRRSSI
jgi:hypothetical protein